MEDTRNLIDEYKGLTNEEVFERLSEKRSALEVAIQNVSHDFNAGTGLQLLWFYLSATGTEILVC